MEYPCSGSEISILKPELKKYTIDSRTTKNSVILLDIKIDKILSYVHEKQLGVPTIQLSNDMFGRPG